MATIAELEADVQVEQDALARAMSINNRVAAALYTSSLARAEERLRQARIRQGEM